MRTIFGITLVWSVLFFSPKVRAQDKITYHLGFQIESLYPPASNHLTYRNKGLMLRKVHRPTKAWRFQFIHRLRELSYPTEFSLWLQDTIKTSRLSERQQTIFFGTGYDVIRM